ncbi:DUF1616 domain-containing protein [Candidatus Methanoperedens nitratireducens]|uniref:Uncharacterized protein n=1 Tax=Candidatus Methanoperedens nitratireducens TaxID=1392998 RepID=A0A284VTJ4_9EURY|nr:DUF1616 domain-containing protein [Candidatus Methanoperedens nitroreducens]SNQ62600.1 hypothetical protein MNV_790045 [Candidatus Methanoperedens nitroreducens]
MPILFIIIAVVGGIGASFALIKLAGEKSQSQPELTTAFYAVNESEIFYGKPASYRIMLENHEGKTIDYEIKVRLTGEEIYSKEIRLNSGSSFNQTISFTPNLTDGYPKLEFLLYKNNETYRAFAFQIIPATNIPALNYGLEPNVTVTIVPQNYTKQQNGDIISYRFDTGEKLELKILKDSVKPGDAIYTTPSEENKIIFLGETYEKILPAMVNFLYPVILDMKDKKLKINETFKIKEGYAVTLEKITNQSLQFIISKDNITVKNIMAAGDSPIEYWKEIDDYKKYKTIIIYPKQVNQDELVFDIVQYRDQKVIIVGDKYGEFQVTDIGNNSITMKNIQPIKIETGEIISLMDGKIKIRV